MKKSIRFNLNGQPATVDGDEDGTLLWALRTQLGLTGTKHGCGEGLCGACTVMVNGRAARSCTTRLRNVAGKDVRTVEGMARSGALHPLQQAFIDHGALQCGFCTPGMLLASEALLQAKPNPSRDEILAHLEHNLCRCGAHQRILDAVQAAARVMRGEA